VRSIGPLLFAAAICSLAVTSNARAVPLLGPVLPYTSFNDSPFKGKSFSSFKLVSMTDYADGPLTVPGVTITPPGSQVIGPGGLIDSVDGAGNNGHSLFSGCGACGLTFTFSAAVLGQLPTAAGIVWTDGDFVIHFSAVDANGNSLRQINDSSGCDFATCGDGDPDNYRFFGAIDPIGIKSITISNDGGGIEVDHLQFGVLSTSRSVPEPSTLAIFAAGILAVFGFGVMRTRRRARAA